MVVDLKVAVKAKERRVSRWVTLSCVGLHFTRFGTSQCDATCSSPVPNSKRHGFGFILSLTVFSKGRLFAEGLTRDAHSA